jgi:signal transduction histidine kinase
VPRSPLFPATLLNDVLFQEVFNVPLEAVQTILALSLAIGLIAALKMFEIERQTALETAQRRARESTQRQEAMRREMLRHTVDAQEEERRRIARELHDETGQLLTALSLGLENLLHVDPDQVPAAVDDLRRLTDSATDELHRLVADLRPSQLDHLGLAAALRALAQQTRKSSGVRIDLSFSGQRRRLRRNRAGDFSHRQEAVTNVVATPRSKTQVWIEYTDECVLASISDDGVATPRPDFNIFTVR